MDNSATAALTSRGKSHPNTSPTSANALTARLASTPNVMSQAYAVRYKSYHHHGYLENNELEEFSDEFDQLDTSRTVVVYQDRMPVGSVRVCLYDRSLEQTGSHSIPAMHVFPDVLDQIISENQSRVPIGRAAEICRLVVDPAFENNTEIVFALFRMAKYLIKYFYSDMVIFAARSNHAPFYRRLGFRKMCEPRDYKKLNFRTALLLGIETEYEPIQQKTKLLRDVKRDDATFLDLISGHEFPVFGSIRNGASVGAPERYQGAQFIRCAA